MNFLAHSYLTPEGDEWKIGNLIADLIRRKEVYYLPEKIQQGVFLHYKIDQYTDQHESTKSVNSLLRSVQGKYAPVASDLIWDLCLADQWDKMATSKLSKHIKTTYKQLKSAEEHLFEKLTNKIDFLIDRDFLTMYTAPDTMHEICLKIHSKAKFNTRLPELMDQYKSHKVQFIELSGPLFEGLKSQIPFWKEEILNQA